MRVVGSLFALIALQVAACVQGPTPRAAHHDLDAIATEFDVVAVRDQCVPKLTSSGRLRKVVRDISLADPWGSPYVVRSEGGVINILSLGEDGKLGTDDDIASRSIYAPFCSKG